MNSLATHFAASSSRITHLGILFAVSAALALAGCGAETTAPTADITRPEADLASIAIFDRLVVRSIHAQQVPSEDVIIQNFDCLESGTARLQTDIFGTANPDAGAANLTYNALIEYSDCVEEDNDPLTIGLNSTESAPGVYSEFFYSVPLPGRVQVSGELFGEVEITTASTVADCQFRLDFSGSGVVQEVGPPQFLWQLTGRFCGIGINITN